MAKNDQKTDIALIKQKLDGVETSIKKIEDYYVNHDQFFPVKLLVYGLAGGVLLTVLGAVLALVVMPGLQPSAQQSVTTLTHVERNQ